MEYTFNNQNVILSATDKSYNQIVQDWTAQVANDFNLSQKTLTDLFDYNTDKHNSEMRTRYMWKYSTFRGTAGTPSAYINGVLLQIYPSSANEWLKLLKSVVSG
jgi:hypothetical protein